MTRNLNEWRAELERLTADSRPMKRETPRRGDFSEIQDGAGGSAASVRTEAALGTSGRAETEDLTEDLADAAEMREAWVRFSRLLDATDASWDERLLADALDREEREQRRRLAWSLVLALSLVGIVMGAIVWIAHRGQSTFDLIASRQMSRDAMVSNQGRAFEKGGLASSKADESQRVTGAAEATVAALAWDDDLDSELGAARETLFTMRAQWQGTAGRSEWLAQRLDDLRSEWESDSL